MYINYDYIQSLLFVLKNLPIGTYDFVDDIDIWKDLADQWDNNLI